MSYCKICYSESLTTLYTTKDFPIFQNITFSTYERAIKQKKVDINLSQCNECGFVFNSLFDSTLLKYDENYQNEQSHSQEFSNHLDVIVEYLKNNDFKDNKILEIGCGKGAFVELLQKNGFQNVYGIDPAYEGDNKNIIKDKFDARYNSFGADLIICRHILEHIEKPYEFLEYIQSIAKKDAKILIEVPNFDWIVENKAFWDIFYEHCNYFDKEILSSFFINSKSVNLFGGQYSLILANISKLKKPYTAKKYPTNIFDANFNKIEQFLKQNSPIILWGAASKGVAILNSLDKRKEFVRYCIDINPKKQNQYMPITGHKIYSPLKTIRGGICEF